MNDRMPQEETYYFLLSATRRALFGEIPPCFRAITVEWKDITAHLFFYIDGAIFSKLHDDCTSVGAEVIASFSKAKISEHIIRLDYPNPLPKHSHWAFRRYEPLKSDNIEPGDYDGPFHSAQYSLLGKILPTMRGIALEINNQTATLLFYIDGSPDKGLLKVRNEITATMKSLNPGLEILQKTSRIDYPHLLPKHDLGWIYLRKESS